MYQRNLFIILGVTFLSLFQLNGQRSLTLSTDPLTIIALGGFEVEAGYSFGKNRVTLSTMRGSLPPWFTQQEDFERTKHSVIDVSYSRWLNTEHKGFSYGVSYTYFNRFKVEDKEGEILRKNPSKLGVRLSYAWFPFKKVSVFIEPIMTFGFMLGDKDLNFSSGQTFDKVTFIGNGPILNIGYKFNLKKREESL